MTCRQLNHLESLIPSKFYCLYNLGQGLCKSRNFKSFLNLSSTLLLKLLSFILLSGFWFLFFFFFAFALMAQYIFYVTLFHLEEILPSSSLYVLPNLSSMILFDSWQKWYRCLIFFLHLWLMLGECSVSRISLLRHEFSHMWSVQALWIWKN